MTIPSTPRKAGPLNGNGVTTSFPFSFKVFAEEDIAVAIANAAKVETQLVLNTDYSVTLNANQETSPGGSVTYPLTGSPLPTGSVLSIVGDVDYAQDLDLPSGGNYSPLALENQLDLMVMQIQQVDEAVGRSVKVPITYNDNDLETFTAGVLILADKTDDIAAVAAIADDVTEVGAIASSLAPMIEAINNSELVHDIYLGSQASNPTTRLDGTPLQNGDFYFNSASEITRIYYNSAWYDSTAPASVSVITQTLNGTGSQTAFTLSAAPASLGSLSVFVGGIRQRPTDDYTLSGTTLTFVSAPAAGTKNILATWINAVESLVVADESMTLEKLDPAIYGTSGANKLLQLDADGKLPALSAENLTDLPTSGITSATLPTELAGLAVGGIGTYAFLGETTTTQTLPGATRAGSGLRYTGHYSNASHNNATVALSSTVGAVVAPTAPSGTWMACGVSCGSGYYGATLWKRVS